MKDSVFKFDLGDKVYLRYLDKEGIVTAKRHDSREGITYVVKYEEDNYNYSYPGEPPYSEYLGKKLVPVEVKEKSLELLEKYSFCQKCDKKDKDVT